VLRKTLGKKTIVLLIEIRLLDKLLSDANHSIGCGEKSAIQNICSNIKWHGVVWALFICI
jgi:hypothetical protein